ncbi:MAG TPA: class I SAM-dependent methyltransferase, partial [Blastocatellia bacterium]|nr:class I SAM-dependent methyltransferase [Blastocatellia bacterium]
MATSPIYRSATLYELAMAALYGRHYASRYREMAELIPPESSVVDLCCGPARIYRRCLKQKSVDYTGLDISPRFIARLRRMGAKGMVWDLRDERALPTADYLIMQASLYHFLPDANGILDRMLSAAGRQVIVSETVRNVASSNSRIISLLAQLLTDPGVGKQVHRFTEATLDGLFERYSGQVARILTIAGGREKVYVLNARGEE